MIEKLLTAVSALLVMVPTAFADEIWISIAEPKNGDFAMGDVLVVADVVAAGEVAEVEFFLDGRAVGVVTSEPFRLRVDLGEANTAHRLQVVGRDRDGNQATDTIVTQAVPINAEIAVELQQLYVTVSEGGKRLLNLDQEDFTVVDEGQEQELVTFARGDIPFTAALLIDASASMHGEKLAAATEGAARFVRGMQDLDHAKVLVFSDTILNSTPFTGSKQVLTAGLGAARARGGTALHDHLYAALKLLEERQGRRVVVLLSDGIDSHSVIPMESVHEMARRSQALIYWIRLRRQTGGPGIGSETVNLSSAWRDANDYRAHLALLERTVRDSGGQILDVTQSEQIRPVFGAILRELREQYVLGYYPSIQRDNGSWHRVRVRVSEPRVEVRTHEGYIDL